VLKEVREEHQNNTRGTRNVLSSYTVTVGILVYSGKPSIAEGSVEKK
jgi:hypothetical protein